MENERPTIANRIISDIMKEKNLNQDDMPVEETQETMQEEQPQQEPMGLMSRRA